MRKGDDGEKKRGKRIMMKKVATNVVASRPTATPPIVPKVGATLKSNFILTCSMVCVASENILYENFRLSYLTISDPPLVRIA